MGEGNGERKTCIKISLLHFLITAMVGSMTPRPLGWDMHFGSRKKFCMSAITNSVVLGAIVTEVSAGLSVVSIVNLGVEELDML